jgi:hypothetical protein
MVVVLAFHQVGDHGFKVGHFGVGFAPHRAEPAKVVLHYVDRLIVAVGHDRGRPAALRIAPLHATEPGFKPAIQEPFLPGGTAPKKPGLTF